MNWKRYILLPLALFLTEANASQVRVRKRPKTYATASRYMKPSNKQPTWFDFDPFYLIPLIVCIALVSFSGLSLSRENQPSPPDGIISTDQGAQDNDLLLMLLEQLQAGGSNTRTSSGDGLRAPLPTGPVTEDQVDKVFWVKLSGFYVKKYTTDDTQEVIPYKTDKETRENKKCIICWGDTPLPVRPTCCKKTCYCLQCVKGLFEKSTDTECPKCRRTFSTDMKNALRIACRLIDNKEEKVVLKREANTILSEKLRQEVNKQSNAIDEDKEDEDKEDEDTIDKVKNVLENGNINKQSNAIDEDKEDEDKEDKDTIDKVKNVLENGNINELIISQ